MSSTKAAGITLAILGLTLGVVGLLRSPDSAIEEEAESEAEVEVEINEVVDRFVEIIPAPAPVPSKESSPSAPAINMDAGEGMRASTAQSTGVLQAVGQLDAVIDSSALDSDLTGGIGGLIGTKGTQIGSGGLGSRGSGLGGGGIAAGLGGLGTKGRGSGRSGYGSGGGSFGGKQAAPPRQEGYTSYGINAQTLVENDHLSTFSIDVDTASYTIARSKLLTGALPPEAAVRVEEFVNYFDYRYADRADEAPFAVYMEAAPSPWEPTHHVVRVGLQGDRLDEDDRKPVRLTFLVDVSGSMSASNKLPLARKAMRHLVGNLGAEDSVAITTYAGRTEVLLQPTAASDLSIIHAAIETLQSGGGTNMDSGVQLAYQLADRAFVEGAENRVVVLSDGDANIGRTSHEALLTEITDYAKKGITMSSIGFGRGNYQDTLMEQLANKGDGNYFYIDDYTEAKKVFGQDLSGTIQTIARDVKIQVDFDPAAVLSYRLIGYENRDIADADFRNDAVDAGEIGAGHSVTALYDVILRDGYRTHDGPLATVRLRAKPPGADAAADEWYTAFPAADVRDELAETTDSFRLALGAATFAEKLRGSHYVAELTYREIAALVGGARQSGVAIEAELEQLITQAGTLAGESGLASR